MKTGNTGMTKEEKLVRALGNVSEKYIAESASLKKGIFDRASTEKTLSVIVNEVSPEDIKRAKRRKYIMAALSAAAAIAVIGGGALLISTLAGMPVSFPGDHGDITITLPSTDLPVINEPIFETSLDHLRRIYPEYFGLSAFKGIEIYVRTSEDGELSFAIMSGTDMYKEKSAVASLRYIGASDMRLILGTYNFSSMWYDIFSAQPDGSYEYIPSTDPERDRLLSLLGIPRDDTTSETALPKQTEPDLTTEASETTAVPQITSISTSVIMTAASEEYELAIEPTESEPAAQAEETLVDIFDGPVFIAPPETEPVTKTLDVIQESITNDNANPGHRVTDGIVFNSTVYYREFESFEAGLEFKGLMGGLESEYGGFEGYSEFFDEIDDMLMKLRLLCDENGSFDPSSLEKDDAPQRIAYYGDIYTNDLIPAERSHVYYLNSHWLLRLYTTDTSELSGRLSLLYAQSGLTEIRRALELIWANSADYPSIVVRLYDNNAPGEEGVFDPEGLYLSLNGEESELDGMTKLLSENGIDVSKIETVEFEPASEPDAPAAEPLPITVKKTFGIQNITYTDEFPMPAGTGSYFEPVMDNGEYTGYAVINGSAYALYNIVDRRDILSAISVKLDRSDAELFAGAIEPYCDSSGDLSFEKLSELTAYSVCGFYDSDALEYGHLTAGYVLSEEAAIVYVPHTDGGGADVLLYRRDSLLSSVRRVMEYLWEFYESDMLLDAVTVTDQRNGGYEAYLRIIADAQTLSEIQSGLNAAGIDISCCRFVTREQERSSYIPAYNLRSTENGFIRDELNDMYNKVFDSGYYAIEFPLDMSDEQMVDAVRETGLESDAQKLGEYLKTNFEGCPTNQPYSGEYDLIKLEEEGDVKYSRVYYEVTDMVEVEVLTYQDGTSERVLYIKRGVEELERDEIRKTVRFLRLKPSVHPSGETRQFDFEIRAIEVIREGTALNAPAKINVIADERYWENIREWLEYWSYPTDSLQFSEQPTEITEIDIADVF